MDRVLACDVSAVFAAHACMAGLALACFRGKDGAELPFLSQLAGVGSVEPDLCRSGNAGRQRGDLQSCANRLRFTCNCFAGRVYLRRDAQLRRPDIPASRVRDGDWRIRMDLRARVSVPWGECRRRSSAGTRLGGEPGSRSVVRLCGISCTKSEGEETYGFRGIVRTLRISLREAVCG